MCERKQCKQCLVFRPLTAFHKRTDSRDGRRHTCKGCHTSNTSAFRAKYPERRQVYDRRYYDANAEELNLKSKHYKILNRHKTRFYKSKERALRLRAMPEWVCDILLAQIEDVYLEAYRLEVASGEEHHVDHIEPLRGKDRCGLHVPWNLQPLTKTANLKKTNKT